MSQLVLTRESAGVVRAKSSNPMDSTTILRISRPYWQHTPTESGVYILLGEHDGNPTVYVGMSTTDMRSRIAQHHVTPEKNWFGTLYAIPLNVALVQGIEAELIRTFTDADFAQVANRASENKWIASDNLAVSAVLETLVPWLEVLLGTEVVYGVELDVVSTTNDEKKSRPPWTQDEWLDWVENSGPAGMRPRMEQLISEWKLAGRRLSFGNGAKSAALFPVIDAGTVNYWLFGVYDRNVELHFQSLARRPLTDSIELREEIADRLSTIDGVLVSSDQLERRPSFPVEVLLDARTGDQLLAVEAWLAELVCAANDS